MKRLSVKESFGIVIIFIIAVVLAIFTIKEMQAEKILSIYTDNINSFLATIEENKGKPLSSYKEKLNERIKCEETQCSYLTDYKNEMIKNTDVVFQLKPDKSLDKIVYKFDAIKRVDSESAETRKNMENYYIFLEKELENKNVDVYYTSKDNTKIKLDECFKTVGCLFVIEPK